MGGGSHKRASCEISVRYPRSECTIRSRHQMARMRVHRHSKCCRYASAAGKIVASVSVCRPRWPHGGNLKHSHTLKIRRPSVLTPGKYPASLSQLRILRSNYEYGIGLCPMAPMFRGTRSLKGCGFCSSGSHDRRQSERKACTIISTISFGQRIAMIRFFSIMLTSSAKALWPTLNGRMARVLRCRASTSI